MFSVLFNSCIKDDIVADQQDEILSFTSANITTLAIKETHQFETRYSNNIGVVTTPDITWQSSNPNIISLSNSGLATAVAPGQSTITASTTTDTGKVVSAEQTIDVTTTQKSIIINNVIEELIITGTHQYQTTYTNELGNVDNTVSITWASSNNNIISVDQNGLITASASGEATITVMVTLDNQDVISFEDTVTVVAIAERLSINNPTETLDINNTYQYTTTYTNNAGETDNNTAVNWTSSNPSVLTVNSNGLATAISGGNAVITATVTSTTGTQITDTDAVTVNAAALQTRSGQLQTTTFYVLQGGFTITEIPNTNDLELKIDNTYETSDRLPGLYLYLTNNINSIANAKEIQAVTVFKSAHSYILKDTGINDFTHLLYWCKPFGVVVGNGEIK